MCMSDILSTNLISQIKLFLYTLYLIDNLRQNIQEYDNLQENRLTVDFVKMEVTISNRFLLFILNNTIGLLPLHLIRFPEYFKQLCHRCEHIAFTLIKTLTGVCELR